MADTLAPKAGRYPKVAEDQQIVGRGPRGALHGFDEVGPGMKQERHHGHAQRASLGDAARVEVWHSKASTYSIEIDA